MVTAFKNSDLSVSATVLLLFNTALAKVSASSFQELVGVLFIAQAQAVSVNGYEIMWMDQWILFKQLMHKIQSK